MISGSQSSMLSKGPILSRRFVRSALSVLFLIAWIPLSFGQEPPLGLPGSSRLPAS